MTTAQPLNPDPGARLSRTAASEAVGNLGWRYLLGTLCLSVPVATLAQASAVAGTVLNAGADGLDAHLRLDLRPDRVDLSLQSRAAGYVTTRDTTLAQSLSAALETAGFPVAGPTSAQSPRPVQMLELAIDTLDVGSIRPFWKAVTAYVDDPGGSGPYNALVDPAGQLPAIWFQSMDGPRPQRNRIHLDLTVAHDEADARVQAAIRAGGHLVNDSYARAFWVLADAEGNEVCVCTWLDRDERRP